MKNLYTGSYKILLKKLKTQYIERSQAHRLEDLIMLLQLPKAIYRDSI